MERLWFGVFVFFLIGWSKSCRGVVGQSISLDEVKFLLFTRENTDEPVRLTVGDSETLQGSGFNASCPTKFYTHGFLNDVNDLRRLKNALLVAGDFNLIGVDWSACSKQILYDETIECVKIVGNYIGLLIQFIQQHTQLNIKDVHLLGHSLGAHVMAFVSEMLPDSKVPRISAFDPAGPLFEHVNASERLDPTDADFVDAIHTNVVLFGIKQAVGTVDFYPNGGKQQPDCSVHPSLTCNHGAAVSYFTKTIHEESREAYIGYLCSSVEDAMSGNCSGEEGIMGYDAIKSKPGIYFLNITEPPTLDAK